MEIGRLEKKITIKVIYNQVKGWETKNPIKEALRGTDKGEAGKR